MENNWKYKSLVSLQKMKDFIAYPNPPTRLVRRCEELLQMPLNEYSIEDIRLMIGQQLGLQYLIPLAVEKLQEDLFSEGDFFPGDLLSNVLKVDPGFWIDNRGLQAEVNKLIENRKVEIEEQKISLALFESSL
jgi:hypothetical protein